MEIGSDEVTVTLRKRADQLVLGREEIPRPLLDVVVEVGGAQVDVDSKT